MVRLFDHITSELLAKKTIEVIGPPGILHHTVCEEAAESLNEHFPDICTVNAVKHRHLESVVEECSRVLKLPECNDLMEFVRLAAARTRKFILVIRHLDVLCAWLLSGGSSATIAQQIIVWLSQLTGHEEFPVVVSGTLEVKSLIRLINPTIDGSPQSLRLVRFPDHTRLHACEWEAWCDMTFPHIDLSMEVRLDLQNAACRNPEAIRAAFEAKGNVGARRAAISARHIDFAERILGLIPLSKRRFFLAAALDIEAPSGMKKMVGDSGVVDAFLPNPYWVEHWKRELLAAEGTAK